jgi:serine/threonine-protein kinase RsbW
VSGEAIHLRFPARPEYLLLARLAVTAVARRMALGRAEVADLKLAVTEACSNAVRHAYGGGPPGEIELEVAFEDDRLELVVEDHGAGIRLPLREDGPPSEDGGMGLPLIRAVVDELEIRRAEQGTGTVVHMTKLARSRQRANGADGPEV